MGYIPDSNRTLTAYLTQKGREYVVSGDRDGFTIKYFSLGDPDVNYNIASQVGEDGKDNMLPKGSIPDLSGDDDGAVHSLAGGIRQRFSIYGGTTIKHLGTNQTLGSPRNVVRFQSDTLSVNLTKTGLALQQLSFSIPIEVVGSAVTGYESAKVYVLPPSQGTDSTAYSIVSVDNTTAGIYSWAVGSASTQRVNCIVNYAGGSTILNVKLRIVPYKSAVSIDPDKGIITVAVAITQTTTAAPASGRNNNNNAGVIITGDGTGTQTPPTNKEIVQ